MLAFRFVFFQLQWHHFLVFVSFHLLHMLYSHLHPDSPTQKPPLTYHEQSHQVNVLPANVLFIGGERLFLCRLSGATTEREKIEKYPHINECLHAFTHTHTQARQVCVDSPSTGQRRPFSSIITHSTQRGSLTVHLTSSTALKCFSCFPEKVKYTAASLVIIISNT